MSAEIPLEITHLRSRLRQDFMDKLPEATFGSGEEKERNFLTRALAALAIQRLSSCSLDEAAAAVVDGGGDSGIDGIQYSPTVHRLWVVQSKFFADGHGEPSLGDVSKFKNGIEALLQGQFEVFRGNATLARRIPQCRPNRARWSPNSSRRGVADAQVGQCHCRSPELTTATAPIA